MSQEFREGENKLSKYEKEQTKEIEVGWAARRSFQERWLVDNKKITVV